MVDPAAFDFDVIVLGAGAAGLMAAIHAAERGRRVLLLEKGKKPGVKILMSGGTRCNITHDCDNRGIVEAFGPNGKFLHSALANFGVRDTINFFEAEGVATKVEDTGKIFPVSDRALDVLNALLRRLGRTTVKLTLNEPARDVVPLPEGGFRVVTDQRSPTCQHVVVTTGGLSFPGCGTTGDGYGFTKKFGHTIVPTRPALVPVTVQPTWIKELQGVTLPHIGLKVLDENKSLTARRGSTLFAHFGLTGPAPLDVSRAISGHATPTKLMLEVDLLPKVTEQAFDEFLRTQTAANGKQLLAGVMSEMLTRRVCDQLLQLSELPLDRRAAALSKVDRLKLVAAVKRLRLPVRGTLGYEKAEVTAGGVSLDEVDSRTMQSKRQPGLFLAGELLDLDGWIGGYNFQSAWSTGWLAGQNV
ncbi:BaiN/RdsA family NAD(P)/FAD-dependent oxidoreductase [Limnoglobus roseus]|uniref:NAD(P)/FAD-dependent oxidoreductase n=1 Tax=Limnoglobus roseus TaxID=2598579 RepID=A0A5C1ABZ3_9BACT|nr:NAD(P)/FAD-dependent oxidoreductase [Limnoglobus roseus]QEL16889.1 NAD(P)/FAD-dependent oxidoreductase [Limnoglobus roseus]